MTAQPIDSLLASYPRERPPLTEAHRAVYVEEYKINRGGSGLLYRAVHKLEEWGHRKVASRGRAGESILEIGAGSLNHLRYESGYSAYDCVEPFAELYAKAPEREQVRAVYDDIADLPADARYDRILSLAVLEHLTDLPRVVASAALRLDEGGLFQAAIPSEGGLIWGLSWRCTTGLAYRLRTGLDYGVLMRHEHVNDAPEITAVVRHCFGDLRIARFPLPTLHTSFYTYLEASRPDTARCRALLEGSRATAR